MSERDAIEVALRAVEPAVRLVPVRRLRKLLHYLRDHDRAVPLNANRPLWVARSELLAADCLPDAVLSGAEDPLLLITTPDDRVLDALPLPVQLREYWRLAFQARVMAALDRKFAEGALTSRHCEARLAGFGPAAVREIRYVLESDHLAEPEADAAAIYRAFAATYLDLNAFAPDAAADCFPSLPPAVRVLDELGRDLDAIAILSQTRPAGSAEAIESPVEDRARPLAAPSEARTAAAFLARALEAEQKGNFVRAAILRTRAGGAVGDDRELLEAGTRSAIGKLVHELSGVLGWDEAAQREWRHALAPLLEPAAAGTWPPAARCLYELQKIPSDLAREVFAVDLVEPIRTLGRRPVKRPLPLARDVMLLLKLRAAHKQLLRSGLAEPAQAPLEKIFHREMHGIERAIRHALAPIVAASLAESGFRPANRVEEVARDKIVAELLDRVCERGYLRFGDLRDAIARNQLKMRDMDGPVEFVAGDPLLRADTRLAYDLDGIYRRGEFYLRVLQRGSSLFFGTQSGRWLFLYLIAPVLAAFLTLTFAIELQHIGGKAYALASKILAPKKPPTAEQVAAAARERIVYYWDDQDRLVWVDLDEYEWDDAGNLYWVDHDPEYEWDDDGNLITFDPDELGEVLQTFATSSAAKTPAEGEHHESPLPNWEPVFVFGVFLLLLFHAPPFRRAFLSVAAGILAVLRSALWDVPARIIRSRFVVAIRYSAPVRLLGRYLAGSLIVTAGIVLLLSLLGASPGRLLRAGGIILAAATIAFNTPWGWDVQERLAESLSDGWRTVRANLLPGLVATMLDWFHRLANWIERQLYAVDEWLRYRGGDSGSSFVTKALIGLVWFPFAYLARFAFYLLIEPQINPVKHFPVVTVSHKVILPLAPNLAQALDISGVAALWLLAGVPGIFGFIAWELLANWKLYAANRPEWLKPVVIGSHGESMRGLLRPGFHSGAVPKLFRKLRHAKPGSRPASTRLHHDLHHCAEGVHRFIERELVALLARDPDWGGLKIAVAKVRFGCQRAVVDIAAPELDGSCLAVAFENRGGRIAANLERPGWLDKLTNRQRESLFAALRGAFDMAVAELVDDRERGPPADFGTAELIHTFSWSDWVRRWNGKHD